MYLHKKRTAGIIPFVITINTYHNFLEQILYILSKLNFIKSYIIINKLKGKGIITTDKIIVDYFYFIEE